MPPCVWPESWTATPLPAAERAWRGWCCALRWWSSSPGAVRRWRRARGLLADVGLHAADLAGLYRHGLADGSTAFWLGSNGGTVVTGSSSGDLAATGRVREHAPMTAQMMPAWTSLDAATTHVFLCGNPKMPSIIGR